MQQRLNRRLKLILLVIPVLLIILSAAWFSVDVIKINKAQILKSPLVHRLIPIYHSFRKIPDILFMPYYEIFTQSNLEPYELIINPSNIERMNQSLPENPFGSNILASENKLWVTAQFQAPGYKDNVKVRYRGNLANHWNSYKKSYLVKFPKDNLFRGMREIVLIIPRDRGYFSAELNDYRSEKLNLFSLNHKFVGLSVNGSPSGVYYELEHWSQEMIEKRAVSALSTLYGIESTPGYDHIGLFTHDSLPFWKSWNADEPLPTDPLETLFYILNNTIDEEFEKLIPLIVNTDAFIGREVLNALAQNNHNTAASTIYATNIVLLFDATTGLFEPVPYNTNINSFGDHDVVESASVLQKRLFSVPKFNEMRTKAILSYIENHKEEDLVFLNSWLENMNKEFYTDYAMLENNFMYRKKVKFYYDSAAETLDKVSSLVPGEYSIEITPDPKLKLPETFRHLRGAILSPNEFVKNNRQFYVSGNKIHLPAGRHHFNSTVIVPAETTLVIHPGATLLFTKDASLISYSPTVARGTQSQPISIRSQKSQEPWGVFAVLNTSASTSYFDYLNISGGGEKTLGGILISGMLALHDADAHINNSSFSNNFGDDALNIKKGAALIENSSFSDTYSDGIDVDFPNIETIITSNTFSAIGGDAIDLSWSNIVIDSNKIISCVDKGISAGERSNIVATDNIIENCSIGIASKDQSKVYITSGELSNNQTAISAYQKKPHFGGAFVEVSEKVEFTNNNVQFFTDPFSTIETKK